MGTRLSKRLVAWLTNQKKLLKEADCLDAVLGIKDAVNLRLERLMKSTDTMYPTITIRGCCYSWRLATEAAEKKFDPERFTS